MNAGDKFTFEGKVYVFWKASGETHMFAQEHGNANTALRRISYAALISDKAATESMNPRFVAFRVFTDCVKTGAARNVQFMNWVAKAVSAFAKTKGGSNSPLNPFRIQDQDEFTSFILSNGHTFEDKQ